jgi:ABC-type transport system involved in multi-copper enzyme maturation permease subunit
MSAALLFDNPVLDHEVRQRVRVLRRLGGVGLPMGLCLGLFAVAYIALIFFLAGHDANTARGEDNVCSFVVLLCLLVPGLAAGSIAGERRRGAWEPMLVTRLTPAELIVGKFAGVMVWPLLVILLAQPVLLMTTQVPDWPLTWRAGVPITLATCAGLAGVSMLCSARCRSHRAALTWSYGLTFALAFAPVLLTIPAESLHLFNADRAIAVTAPLCPLGMAIAMFDPATLAKGSLPFAWAGVAVYLVLAVVCLAVIIQHFEPWLGRDAQRSA